MMFQVLVMGLAIKISNASLGITARIEHGYNNQRLQLERDYADNPWNVQIMFSRENAGSE
ncbi:hypothetical protein MOP93_21055 [Escherichia coli]|uniref:hypothetical protein n=1 Tax=Escherichia coli TaxID=562 RepID=UPI0035B628AF|nr:hypothetical protein [Escherichia coli]